MYNHILVAVDGSDTSNLALKEAIKLAKDQHSALRLIHIVDLTSDYSDAEALYDLECKEALEAVRPSRGREELNSTRNRSLSTRSASIFTTQLKTKRSGGQPTSLSSAHTDGAESAAYSLAAWLRGSLELQANRCCSFAAHKDAIGTWPT